jgi:GAF domain-containing protein
MSEQQDNRECVPLSDVVEQLASEQDADLRMALAELSQMLMSQVGLEDILAHVAEFAVRAIPGADGAGLTLLKDGRTETVAVSAPFVRRIEEVQYGIGEGPCITAAAGRRTVISSDLGADPAWPRFGPRVVRMGIYSALSLPLVRGDEVIGAINNYARTRDAFGPRSAELAELFAVPAAASVETAFALEQARTITGQLEKALTSRAVIDHAIGIIVSRTGCTPTEAFDKLRVTSQQENKRVSAIAQRMLDEATRRARG